MALRRTPATPRTIEALRHEEAKRRNIPSAEYQSLLDAASESPVQVARAAQPRPRPAARVAGEGRVVSGEWRVRSG